MTGVSRANGVPQGSSRANPAHRREVAIVSFAQADNVRREENHNEVEMLLPVVTEVLKRIACTKSDMGFVCSGSADYLVGGPFSFVGALDAVGAWPPMRESHVEMDGAFAVYEAWTMLQAGDCDTALVYSFGRSSQSQLDRVLALQLDPYYMAPLWPDPIAMAALQARAMFDAGKATEEDLAAVAARSRVAAVNNSKVSALGDVSVSAMLDEDFIVSPLRRHAVPPITDGAAAVVLAAGDRARELCSRRRRCGPRGRRGLGGGRRGVARAVRTSGADPLPCLGDRSVSGTRVGESVGWSARGQRNHGRRADTPR